MIKLMAGILGQKSLEYIAGGQAIASPWNNYARTTNANIASWEMLPYATSTTNPTRARTNGSTVVMTCYGNVDIAYSLDTGKTWQTIATAILNEGFAVCWNGKIWVVGGTAGGGGEQTMRKPLLYSYDAVNWTGVADVSYYTAYWVKDICWNGSYFLAVGSQIVGGGFSAKSTDGINWSYFTHSESLQSVCHYKTQTENRFVALAYNGGEYIYTSTDGESWTSVCSVDAKMTTSYCHNIIWNGKDTFIITGQGKAGQSSILYATNNDYTTWNNSDYGTAKVVGACWDGQRFVALNLGTEQIIYSYNGINWLSAGAGILFNQGGSTGLGCICATSAPALTPAI